MITALIKQATKSQKELYKFLIWDRENEMADHQCFTLVTDIDVYFCDRVVRGNGVYNESIKRLVRQYLHKGTD